VPAERDLVDAEAKPRRNRVRVGDNGKPLPHCPALLRRETQGTEPEGSHNCRQR
jgi:hypothetical protein